LSSLDWHPTFERRASHQTLSQNGAGASVKGKLPEGVVDPDEDICGRARIAMELVAVMNGLDHDRALAKVRHHWLGLDNNNSGTVSSEGCGELLDEPFRGVCMYRSAAESGCDGHDIQARQVHAGRRGPSPTCVFLSMKCLPVSSSQLG
jgi:hypothetical protein